MRYKYVTNVYEKPHKNKIRLRLMFLSPPMVDIKEEYLIYDYVGLISSVGGIMGICVGISFYGLSEHMMFWVRKGLDLIKRC